MATENPRRPAEIRALPGHWVVQGDLVLGTVAALLAQGEALLKAASAPIEVNLCEVGRTDSAGLALLLEWLDIARAGGVRITYRRIPEALLDIAGLSNAVGLLGGGAAD